MLSSATEATTQSSLAFQEKSEILDVCPPWMNSSSGGPSSASSADCAHPQMSDPDREASSAGWPSHSCAETSSGNQATAATPGSCARGYERGASTSMYAVTSLYLSDC